MKPRIITRERERIGQFVADRMRNPAAWNAFEAIGLERNGKLIAGVVFDSYAPNARVTVHLAGDGKHWLNREFLHVCCSYAFDQMKCNVAMGFIDADNAASLQLALHFGFSELARIHGGSGDCDTVILKMMREECAWLKGHSYAL